VGGQFTFGGFDYVARVFSGCVVNVIAYAPALEGYADDLPFGRAAAALPPDVIPDL